MPSSLFGTSPAAQPQQGQAPSQQPNMAQQVAQLREMFNGKNPQAVMQLFAQRNPQFAQFMQMYGNSTPEQICAAYGLDWRQIAPLLR